MKMIAVVKKKTSPKMQCHYTLKEKIKMYLFLIGTWESNYEF